MARSPRTERIAPNQPNHIVCRGNNRRRLFSYPRDYLRYLRLLTHALAPTNCALHAYCLMSNHLHLLISPPDMEAASKLMHKVNQRYAQIHNGQRSGSGKLFEHRFESLPIESDAHLQFSVLYINANPFAAALPKASTYRWSSHHFHLGATSRPAWVGNALVPDSWYLRIGATAADRQRAYATAFAEYLEGKRDARFLDLAMKMEPQPEGGARLERPDGSSAAESKSHYG